MPRFTNFLKFDPPFTHVFIFGNMFSASHGFVECWLQAVSIKNVRIYPYLINEGRRNCLTL